MADDTPRGRVAEDELVVILADLFAVFPQRSVTEQDQQLNKRRFNLYCDHLADLPVGLVREAVIALIRTSAFLPSIGLIRANVRARTTRDAAPTPRSDDRERASVARSMHAALVAVQGRSEPVTGPCQGVGCAARYEYTADQVALLQAMREPLLCARCARRHLTRNREEPCEP